MDEISNTWGLYNERHEETHGWREKSWVSGYGRICDVSFTHKFTKQPNLPTFPTRATHRRPVRHIARRAPIIEVLIGEAAGEQENMDSIILLWATLDGLEGWQFMKIHLASKCFSSSSNFSKKGKPFNTYLGGEKINHWMVFIITKSDKQVKLLVWLLAAIFLNRLWLRLLWLLLLSSHVNHGLEFGTKQFMLNLSQWIESSFHSSFFRWFPFPFPIPRKYLPGSLN